MPPAATNHPATVSAPAKESGRRGPNGRQEIDQLYDAIQKSKPKFVGSNGNARVLPDSLPAFLVELNRMLTAEKSVSIVQIQATLTTIGAAAMLGVSRQFLVNLLTQEQIPYHLVGTHRRIYTHDLLRYKAKRDERRHKILRDLAKTEAAQGLYDKIPAVLDDD